MSSMVLGKVAWGWRPWGGLSLAELIAVGAHPECSTAVTINRLNNSHLAAKIDLETECQVKNQQGTVEFMTTPITPIQKIHIHKITVHVDKQTHRTTHSKHTGPFSCGEDGNEIGEHRSKGNRRIKDYFKIRFPFLFLLCVLHI